MSFLLLLFSFKIHKIFRLHVNYLCSLFLVNFACHENIHITLDTTKALQVWHNFKFTLPKFDLTPNYL